MPSLNSQSTAPMHVRQVSGGEEGLVVQVLSAAALHLVSRGQALWGAAVTSQAAVEGHVREGLYHAAFDDDGVVGVFRFQLADPHFWPDIPDGTSAFIHKLAICPHKQGHDLAQILLAHACDLTHQHGRRFLRLDCLSTRPKLSAVYERFGFRHHSQKTLGNTVFERFEFDVGNSGENS